MPMHPSASDDAVLLEHLQLANQQLRSVLADAGSILPELPLPADLQQVHEEEAMALLAEENYQLRQLWQQLQHQQQLQDLEQQLQLQQELELNRSALEFGRLSPTSEQPQGFSPMALASEHSAAQFGSPAAAAADTSKGWASPHAPPGAVMSPVAMRLVAAPSLNTVQLVEAEAAAQLATQAVIQAEAEAQQHMSWQLQQTLQDPPGMFSIEQSRDPGLVTPCHDERPAGSLICSYDQQQQQQQQQAGEHRMHSQRLFTQEQRLQPTPAAMAAARLSTQQQAHALQVQQLAPQHHSGNGRLALPQLPRLTLPRSVTGRRSMESTCSDVGRSSVCSGASGDLTWRSQATGATSHQPLSATGAASARSNASSTCSGLKQLTNDLLLLPPALRASAAATGPDASQETFGSAGIGSAACADYASAARGFGVGHAGAAAGMAAEAAAGIWYPAAAEDSGLEGLAAAAGAKGVGGVLSPSSRAAGVAVDAVRGMMYPGALPTDQTAAAEPVQQQAGGSRGIHAPPQPAALSKGRLRLPQSVFAGATGGAAADVGDVASSDQWYGQQHAQMPSQQQQQQPVHQPPDSGAHGQMPALPPIATSARRAGSGPLPQGPAQSGASAVSQAAAAAAALAGQRFHMQQPIQQQQAQQPFPALRLPPRAQTHEQHQQEPERRSSSFDSSMSDIPPSLPKLRMPAPQQSGAAVAGAGAGGPLGLRLQTQTGTDSYDSSPDESPLSDSAFFRAADSGLFEGGGNGLFDGATDLFGARISMDDSGQRLSCSEAQPSQLPDVPEDYFGLPDSGSGEGGDGYSYCASQQSGWLGVSYQQQSLRGPQGSGLSSARGSQEFFQPMYAGAASAEDGSFGAFRRGRGWGQSFTAADTIDELSELQHEPISRQDTRNSAWSGSAFIATAAAGSMSSLTSNALGHQVSFQGGTSTQPSAAAVAAAAGAGAHLGGQQQERDQEHLPTFPNLAPLRVSTGRQQQDQTPPLTWRPQPVRVDSGGSTARSNIGRMPSSATAAAAVAAATSPAHMAATEAAEAAASVGLAAAATGGMDSMQLQQLLNHLARVAEEASSTVNAAAAMPASAATGRTASAPAGPSSSSTADVLRSAGASDTPADVLRSASSTPVSVRAGMQRSQREQGQHEGQQQGQQRQDCTADEEFFTPVSKGKGGDQEGGCGSAGGQPSRPLSPFAAVGAVSPARTATGGCLVMSPRPPALQRTLSAGQVGTGTALVGLPPKWASRSGSSSNLTAMHSQPSQQLLSPKRQSQTLGVDDTARDAQADQHAHSATVARAVPDRAATVPVPAPAGSLISPRLGLHGRLRVITHAAGAGGYSSNGSNSDADAGSTHTTPMHRPPQGTAVQRSGSGSSFRPAGLASITVPPSPASSGVRYVPASPRVVGFDCPLTPHAYALRSPSWRSEVGVEGSSVGAHPSWVCGSGSSTPRRQASSPGLLQQALSRSGFAPQQHHSQPQLFNSGPNSSGGSGCNTPSSAASAARRAASAAQGSGVHGAGASAFVPPTHATPAATPGSEKGTVGSHGSVGQLKQAGSCSSSALLMTMTGGQLPVLHHQRTSSSPYMDSMQSPGSARRMRSSASGFEAAIQDAHAARAAPAQAALLSAPRSGRAGSSNASSRRSSSDSGSGSPGRVGAGGTAETKADAGLAAAAQPQSDAAAAAGIDVTLELSRSVSPQLRVSTRSRSVSPKLQQVTSPPAHSAQACTEAGQHKLSRFGLAAARASTEKPLAGASTKGAEAAAVVGVPEQGVTAVLMAVGQAGGSDLPTKTPASGCAGQCGSSNSGSSQDAKQGPGEHQVAAAAVGHGAAVAVPDTPAVEAASGGAAFAAQHGLEHELPAVQDSEFSAAVLIEQELQRAAAEEAAGASEHAAPSASSSSPAGAGCSSGCGSGASGSSRQAQRVSWSADPACLDGGCEHHGPPASPCTPQQDAEQQQQQQLQSPDRQQDQHQHQQHVWQQVQQQNQQGQQGLPLSGGGTSPGRDHVLPRSKSAAAYLAGDASAAGPRAASETGTPTASSAASGMWSPTHDVRGATCRHMRRSPSALLMRLAQRQVEVLTGRGKASSTVPYVLPHRSSNPASALRALAAGGSADCSSSQCADQSAAGCSVFARTGSTPRSSLDLGLGSSTSTPRAPLLQPESSWEVEPLQPPQNLIAVASSANPATDVYIPVPGAGEAQQHRQLQQAQACEGPAEADDGPADNRDVLLSAAIVQQRLKSTSKWLGPAPVVAASASANEAKAAAVVTRQRHCQQVACGSDPLRTSMSGQHGASQGSSRVAMTAAALAAAAASADVVAGGRHRARDGGGSGRVALAAAALSADVAAAEGNSLSTQRSCSSGASSRVATAAAALAASGTGPAAAAPARVPGKVRPADAWLAAGPGDSATAADTGKPSCAGRSQEQSEQAMQPASGACPADAAGTLGAAGSKSAQPGSTLVEPVTTRLADEAQQVPVEDRPTLGAGSAGAASGVGTGSTCPAVSAAAEQLAAEAISTAGADAIVPAADVVAAAAADSALPEAPAKAAAIAAVPASIAADAHQGVSSASSADVAAAAAAGGDSDGGDADRQAASSCSPADQVVQLDSCSDAVLTAVRNHQQQLLKQRQLLRQQQQQRKRQEVAAWAQQHADAAVLASGNVTAADAAGDVRPASPDQVTGPAADAAAAGSDAAACCNTVPSAVAVLHSHDVHSQDAAAAADAGAVAASSEAADTLGHLDPSGLGPGLGMQGYEGVAMSVADDFEVQSWAAWSTTSSINRCPKLQWWGNEAGQGRFSQRQQRRLQQQQGLGLGAGRDAAQAQARWWQRLLQARQESGQPSRPGNHGSAAGPSGV